MHPVLCKISQALDSFEGSTGARAHLINLPLVDAQELAAAEWEELDTELDDDLPQEVPVGPASLEGIELFGAVIHVDPSATEIRCS